MLFGYYRAQYRFERCCRYVARNFIEIIYVQQYYSTLYFCCCGSSPYLRNVIWCVFFKRCVFVICHSFGWGHRIWSGLGWEWSTKKDSVNWILWRSMKVPFKNIIFCACRGGRWAKKKYYIVLLVRRSTWTLSIEKSRKFNFSQPPQLTKVLVAIVGFAV